MSAAVAPAQEPNISIKDSLLALHADKYIETRQLQALLFFEKKVQVADKRGDVMRDRRWYVGTVKNVSQAVVPIIIGVSTKYDGSLIGEILSIVAIAFSLIATVCEVLEKFRGWGGQAYRNYKLAIETERVLWEFIAKSGRYSMYSSHKDAFSVCISDCTYIRCNVRDEVFSTTTGEPQLNFQLRDAPKQSSGSKWPDIVSRAQAAGTPATATVMDVA